MFHLKYIYIFFKTTGQRKVVTEFPLSALLEEQLSYVQNGKLKLT